MKFLTVLSLSLFVLSTTSISAWAVQEGHGDGEIARLLYIAQTEEVPQIVKYVSAEKFIGPKDSLARFTYSKVRSQMVTDIQKNVAVIPTNEELLDIANHYPTWIALDPKLPVIRYNSVAYDKLVGTSPEIWGITERLLHEMGHYYKLDERNAWEFARLLIASYKSLNSTNEVLLQTCDCSIKGGITGTHGLARLTVVISPAELAGNMDVECREYVRKEKGDFAQSIAANCDTSKAFTKGN